jgi:hypothetical protein
MLKVLCLSSRPPCSLLPQAPSCLACPAPWFCFSLPRITSDMTFASRTGRDFGFVASLARVGKGATIQFSPALVRCYGFVLPLTGFLVYSAQGAIPHSRASQGKIGVKSRSTSATTSIALTALCTSPSPPYAPFCTPSPPSPPCTRRCASLFADALSSLPLRFACCHDVAPMNLEISIHRVATILISPVQVQLPIHFLGEFLEYCAYR